MEQQELNLGEETPEVYNAQIDCSAFAQNIKLFLGAVQLRPAADDFMESSTALQHVVGFCDGLINGDLIVTKKQKD